MCVLKKYSQILMTRQGKRINAAFIICLFLGCEYLHPMDNNGRGVKAIGMANAFVAVSDNLWAINYNPAGLTQITSIQSSAFLIPEQFGLPELRTTALTVAMPFSFATVGLKMEKFGFELYEETELGIAAACKLDKSVSIGVNLNSHRLDIIRYGTERNVLLNVGLLAHVADHVNFGFTFNNITGTTIGKQNEKIPQVYSVGASWLPLNDLLFSIEIEKDVCYPASIKAGIEQIVFDALALRAGVANNPSKYSAGMSARYSFVEFGYAGYSHVDLGWTHQIELSFTIDN
jgi:hypothetical protein